MSSNELADSDSNDSLLLISPRRRSAAAHHDKKPPHSPNKHYDDLTNSLYSFTYSQNMAVLLHTRLSAMQRSAAAAESTTTSPILHNLFHLLQFLQSSVSIPSTPVASQAKDSLTDSKTNTIDESTLQFLTLPYTDIVKPGDREPSLSLQRPPSMFRRASSMILTPHDTFVQGISTPLEHLPSKYMHMQAVLTTEATFPFGIRTLNDIACLVCVTNQQTAPDRSILDFVAPHFREWLTAKINAEPSARVRLSGELVDLLILSKPKMVSLWVEHVSAERLVWTLQEVSVRTAPVPDTTGHAAQSRTAESPNLDSDPTMRHSINEQHEIVLESPLGSRKPHVIGCAVALDRASLSIRGYNRPTLYFMLGYKGEDLVGKPVTDLLPQFHQFWSKVELLCTNVGVVIPEHKFRELAGIGLTSPEFVAPYPSCDPERSIRAKSKSGTFTYVDIQLRLVDSKSLVLWISYSRACEHTVPDNAMLNVPSQRILLPTIMSRLEQTPSSSSTTASSSDDGSQEQDNCNEEKLTQISPEKVNHSFTSVGEQNIDSQSQLVDKEKEIPATTEGVAKMPTAQTHETEPSVSTIDSSSHAETLNGDSADSGDDDVWADLSKIEVGAQRRSKSVEDYHVLKVLGEGAYGKVSLVRPKNGKYVFAFKSIFKDRILVDTWSRDRKLGTIPNEIRILNQLRPTRHPHIVEMVDYFEDSDCYHIEMLPIGNPQGVDLFDFLEAQASNTSQQELLKIWGQVVSAVAHIHSFGIVHRDIKDENIVMDGKGNAKLIDFGSAAYLKQGPFDVFVGTVDYAAPEIVQGQTYEGCPQDSWALGILLYTIMYKETPFHGIESIIEGNIPLDLNCLGSSLIRRLLVKPSASRPSPARCLEYLKDMEIR